MILQGKAFCFGDHIDTDVIIPARYLTSFDPAKLAAFCMEGVDPAFAASVQPGDFVVAGENFGCGSSREHAPLALKGAGVGCVIAASFARIFHRNAINVGLPIVVCPEAFSVFEQGDLLSVDLHAGTIENHTRRGIYHAQRYPPFLLELIEAGGLIPYTRSKLKSASRSGREDGKHRPARKTS